MGHTCLGFGLTTREVDEAEGLGFRAQDGLKMLRVLDRESTLRDQFRVQGVGFPNHKRSRTFSVEGFGFGVNHEGVEEAEAELEVHPRCQLL